MAAPTEQTRFTSALPGPAGAVGSSAERYRVAAAACPPPEEGPFRDADALLANLQLLLDHRGCDAADYLLRREQVVQRLPRTMVSNWEEHVRSSLNMCLHNDYSNSDILCLDNQGAPMEHQLLHVHGLGLQRAAGDHKPLCGAEFPAEWKEPDPATGFSPRSRGTANRGQWAQPDEGLRRCERCAELVVGFDHPDLTETEADVRSYLHGHDARVSSTETALTRSLTDPAVSYVQARADLDVHLREWAHEVFTDKAALNALDVVQDGLRTVERDYALPGLSFTEQHRELQRTLPWSDLTAVMLPADVTSGVTIYKGERLMNYEFAKMMFRFELKLAFWNAFPRE